MSIGTVSGVQWWTLGVAGLAVLASIAGIIFNALFGRRSEHAVWQRDLRVRLYGECTETADRFERLLRNHVFAHCHPIADNTAAQEQEFAEKLQIVHVMDELSRKGSEVQTFGSRSVRDASFEMVRGLNKAATYMDFKKFTAEEQEGAIREAMSALVGFNIAVRRSLKISDD